MVPCLLQLAQRLLTVVLGVAATLSTMYISVCRDRFASVSALQLLRSSSMMRSAQALQASLSPAASASCSHSKAYLVLLLVLVLLLLLLLPLRSRLLALACRNSPACPRTTCDICSCDWQAVPGLFMMERLWWGSTHAPQLTYGAMLLHATCSAYLYWHS